MEARRKGDKATLDLTTIPTLTPTPPTRTPDAQHYVRRVEEIGGVPVSWIGVGVGREDMAVNGFSL